MGSAPDTEVPREHARRVRDLFDEVVDLDADARRTRLGRVGRADPDLCREVQSLLAAYDRADDVLHRLEWSATEAPDRLVGRSVSHYRVLERLSGGGMGVVYKARDTKLDRTVALKFLPPHLGTDEEAKARFAHEAKAASALDHPNICTIYEIGETDAGQAFIAMAYYEGETLKAKVARGPLPVAEALGVAAQVAEGLRAAHEVGLVHRDVKPANVIVTREGVAKVVDFGIAKAAGAELTKAGAALGTVAYMSPEQTRGEAVDPRTDLWSLGVVLYEMLTGQRPFRGADDRMLIHAIRYDAPEPVERLRPGVPAGRRRVVARCLEKDPAARYQRAEALLSDLRAVHAGGTIREWTKRRPPPRRALLYGGAGVLLVALLAAVGLLTTADHRDPIDSLAVLPVVNLSGDPDQDYFADGMTDLLINQLSQLSGLERVSARASVMRYEGTEKPLQEVGRELGVEALVEASVLREGARVRVNVGLVEAETERALWSRSFERPIRDVLALQREVAQAIVREIEVQLTPREAGHLRQAAAEVDPEAFELYLEGVRWDREANPRERVAYLERAVARDSGFALAYATMADDYAVQLGDYARAEDAVARALALDPQLPRAHVTLGIVRHWAHYDWTGAEDALRRACELAPLDPRAHHELAMLLMRVGRFEEALAEERRTLYLDPTNAEFQSGLGEILVNGRRYDEAIPELEEAMRMDPDRLLTPYVLGKAHFFMGRYDEAVRWYERRLGVPPWVYATLGRREEARAALSLLRSRIERGELRGAHSPAGELALIYTSLGEHEQALDWLERAVDERLGWVPVHLKVEPHLDPLRPEPRFQALLQKVGLAE